MQETVFRRLFLFILPPQRARSDPPTPYTLHPTPHTLHPTPHTLHPTPYTPHPTPHFPNSPLPQFIIYNLNFDSPRQ
ncbi:MAG: hypothetical protein EWV75_01530 [Microcystis wesenbergii Mw_QC_S_20081001_S30D]|uniref:Uncharacterized protein n=1 Tax=Microcystis wesenbergii Mw_QC_S_20081001_S30D TaxID=2486245 RepID=A0A552JZK9_9CHRO|nr:MAG: hypothetical protein EWV73_20955 [Microcystis wesenbergii Mw_QC_B_20070930_S4D]TRU98994.1 MAG: hypothetical protein EWV74_15010 [Microcystis wesenbergii Mw_QC_S_20081001_S30]TRV01184.1 MAG: hypothetical protein EWV75_01530 [Microcystis wesenbergii Mw_QC_S_20081001_S30D]TRV12029.1 MAG: hypothetical protein EWV89_14020 [Microcystis wesenbergii Mw_QC_B_20070930_S4]